MSDPTQRDPQTPTQDEPPAKEPPQDRPPAKQHAEHPRLPAHVDSEGSDKQSSGDDPNLKKGPPIKHGIADADKIARSGTANETVRNTPPAGAWNDTSSD